MAEVCVLFRTTSHSRTLEGAVHPPAKVRDGRIRAFMVNAVVRAALKVPARQSRVIADKDDRHIVPKVGSTCRPEFLERVLDDVQKTIMISPRCNICGFSTHVKATTSAPRVRVRPRVPSECLTRFRVLDDFRGGVFLVCSFGIGFLNLTRRRSPRPSFSPAFAESDSAWQLSP